METEGELAKARIQFLESPKRSEANISKLAVDRLSHVSTMPDPGNEEKTFVVQFNPGELQFDTSEGKVKKTPNFQAKDNQPAKEVYAFGAVSLGVDLNVKLIMDRSIYKDASVQPEVEGFIAATKDPLNRNVLFQWNQLSFEGVLKNVSAEYVMFKPDGTPIRAMVNLTISCRDNSSLANTLLKDYQTLFY